MADRIAIVEDERLVRELVAVNLRHAGYEIVTAENFEQGRELLALLGDRPHTLSVSAHTHMQYQLLLGPEAGVVGDTPHLHLNQGAVAGSWWL